MVKLKQSVNIFSSANQTAGSYARLYQVAKSGLGRADELHTRIITIQICL